MKKFLRALVFAAAFVLPFVFTANAFADGVLKVGYVKDTNFIEEDRPGHYTGYGYEYMEFLASYGGWTFEYVPLDSWKECGEKLNTGEIDILPAMPGYYKSIPNSVRTDHVVGRFPMELVVGDDGIKSHMKIGTLPSNCPTPGFPTIAAGEGFDYELVSYSLYHDMLAAFSAGDIDGYICAMLNPRESQNAWALFDRQSYRVLVRKDRTELLDMLNIAMDQMLLYQPDIRDRLNRKFLRTDGFPLILNRDEREFLRQKKLTAVIFVWQRPYAYRENGEPKGVMADIVKRIADDLGVEIEILRTADIGEAAEALKSGKADFAVDAVCDFSWANALGIKPTQSYLSLQYVPVRRRDAETDENFRIAACSSMLFTKNFVEPKYDAERIIYFDTVEDCFRAVADGKADVTFAPRSEVSYIIEAVDAYNLDFGAESDFYDEISLGVNQSADIKLWHILNKEMNHIAAEWIRNKLNAAEKSPGNVSVKRLIYHYPLHAMAVLALVAAIVMAAFWYRAKMRKRHIAVVQHMAYTDMRYDLPNLAWLEKETPPLLEKYQDNYRAGKFYVTVFSMDNKAAVIEYGRELLGNHLKRMAVHLDKKDWVKLTAIGVDAGQIVCVTLGKDDDNMRALVAEAVAKYSYIKTSDSRIKLNMSAGICAFRESDLSVRQAIDRAITAAREIGGEDVRIFDEPLKEKLRLRQQIEGSMEKALESGEFHAWYQPKYDIKTRKIIGAEALVRWISKDMGFMPPGKFIPLFETNGFVIPVDYCLLEQTFELQKSRLDAGKEVVPISVNQSRLHITEEGYLDKMQALVDKYKLPKGLIELELTETVFGDFDQKEHQKRAAHIVHALHDMGFTMSVDDFGSGYSSFTMLSFLPLDVMKIDRSLLNATGDSQRMRDILGNVIRLGKTLNMSIICEGIETEEQEKLLLDLGCRMGQGYLNAKPMPKDDFVKFFEERNAEVAAGKYE